MSSGFRDTALTAAVLGLMLPALAAAGEGRWTSQGPASEYISAAAVDSSLTIFAATLDSSPGANPESVLFKSPDGGAHWLALKPAPAATYVTGVVADPERAGVVYGLVSSGSLYRSVDGGLSWQLLRNFGTASAGVELDPRDSSVVYVLGAICPAPEGCGPVFSVATVATIWRQRPGQDWEMLAIDGATSVFSLAIDPTIPDRLYAGTDTGVWRSSDAGSHWEAAGRGTESGCPEVSSLAIGPSGTLLLGYFEHYYGFTECGAVYRSSDGATTWQAVRDLPYHALSFAFDPAHAGTAWAAAGDFSAFGVYRSLDGGASWESASEGLDGRVPRQVAIDASGQRIYAATDAGVFDLEVPDSSREVLPSAGPRPDTRPIGPRP